MCCLKETHFSFKDTNRLKVRDEKYIPWKWEPTTAKEVMLMLDKMEFMPKGCKKKKKDKESHCLSIKWLIQQEHITLANIYIPM